MALGGTQDSVNSTLHCQFLTFLQEAKTDIDKETNIPSPAEEIETACLLFSNMSGTAVKWRYVCTLMIKKPILQALKDGQRLQQ